MVAIDCLPIVSSPVRRAVRSDWWRSTISVFQSGQPARWISLFVLVGLLAAPVLGGQLFSDRFELPLFNDTGIDTCGSWDSNVLPCPVQEFPGQDGDRGRDALARAGLLTKLGAGAEGFDFTKLDAAGQVLPASAASWDCVADNVTGLVWEVKRYQPGHLRHVLNYYSWYDPDPDSNGGHAGQADSGFCSGSACDTQSFVQAVNLQRLCGASDWRLPTVMELNELAHRGAFNPVLDTDYFPYLPQMQMRYWTASSTAADPADAWRWEIGNGFETRMSKASAELVRLVRGAGR